MSSERLLGDQVQSVFLTGGSGFIGSHICDKLLAQGVAVTAYDNFSNGRREFTAGHLAIRSSDSLKPTASTSTASKR